MSSTGDLLGSSRGGFQFNRSEDAMRTIFWFICLGVLFFPELLFAGEADVLSVDVQRVGNQFNFSTTVAHNDEGWDHYADKWDVVAPDGHVLATRILYHPHVNEQPFTRSLSGVTIDSEIVTVTVRAHDLVHGYGGKEVTIRLPER